MLRMWQSYMALSSTFATDMLAFMDKEWQARVKGILKAELKRRNVSYGDLANRLAAIGVNATEANIRTKISRGGFTAVFFFQCMEAIGARTIHLDEP